jgi:hypothetical protein
MKSSNHTLKRQLPTLNRMIPEPESESELYYDRRSVGQSVLVSSPIRGLWPDFYYCQTIADLLKWRYLSNERTSLSSTIAAVFASAAVLRFESHGAHDHILLSQIWDSPNLEDQVPVYCIPQEQGGPVIPPGTAFWLIPATGRRYITSARTT